MQIRVNNSFKRPTWLPGESYAIMAEREGAKTMVVTGGIGRSGQKTHALHVEYIDTPNGIGVLDIYSVCGAGKWQSQNIPYFDTDLSTVTCKKCKALKDYNPDEDPAFDYKVDQLVKLFS